MSGFSGSTPAVTCFLLFVAGMMCFLGQLWFRPFDDCTFTKIIVTDVVLFVISLAAHLLVKESRMSEKINKVDLN